MKIQVRSKLWLTIDGNPFLGQGRETLLRLIARHGSINAAAQEMGMTYRKAWSQLKAMEDKCGQILVRRSKGGAGGGQTTLTDEALRLLAGFDQLREGLNTFVDEKFGEIFGGAN